MSRGTPHREAGRLRIIGGRHRGRRIETPAGDFARPTGDRVREALFNILAHPRGDWPVLDGARVLDACAGSGAFGLECLSRGAERAIFFDTSRRAVEAVRRNADALGESAVADLRVADAARPPRAAPSETCALAFLDPPYDSDIAERALPALAKAGWLAEGALVIVERPGEAAPPEAPGFTLEDTRHYGGTTLFFLVYSAQALPDG